MYIYHIYIYVTSPSSLPNDSKKPSGLTATKPLSMQDEGEMEPG